ncbi:hypothetical protein [Actinoplanes sp. NPDC048796]|uniref:hypothetical protein n=1 Tax=Actinoplanes sp. NPDC048796 TaxID=3155640 RepID=UPI0033CE711A
MSTNERRNRSIRTCKQPKIAKAQLKTSQDVPALETRQRRKVAGHQPRSKESASEARAPRRREVAVSEELLARALAMMADDFVRQASGPEGIPDD